MATLPKDSDWQVKEPVLGMAEEEASGLPPLPLEDVYLHVKTIDNSRLDRARAGAVSPAYGRALGLALLALGISIVILMPTALQRLEERHLLVLQAQRQSLLAEQARLAADYAGMVRQERLKEWERTNHMVDPAPGQVVSLAPLTKPALNAQAAGQESDAKPDKATQ